MNINWNNNTWGGANNDPWNDNALFNTPRVLQISGQVLPAAPTEKQYQDYADLQTFQQIKWFREEVASCERVFREVDDLMAHMPRQYPHCFDCFEEFYWKSSGAAPLPRPEKPLHPKWA